MRNAVRNWMDGIPIRDPIERQQAFLFQILLIGIGAVTGLATVRNIFTAGAPALTFEGLTPNLLSLLYMASALALLRRGQFRLSLLMVIGALLAGLAYTFFSTGLLGNSGGLVEFIIPITLAGLLGGRRALVLTTGLSAAIVISVAILQPLGFPSVSSTPAQTEAIIATVVGFVLIVGLWGLLLDRFGSALHAALAAAVKDQQELAMQAATLLKTNEELVRQIAERQRIEAELCQSQERFYKAFHASPVAQAITRLADGCVVEMNKSYQQILGYSREDVIGHSLIDATVYSDPAERAEVMQRLQAQGSVHDYETKLHAQSGELRDVLASWETIELAGETCVLATIYDHTERRRAAETDSPVAAIGASAEDAIIGQTLDGAIVSWNEAAGKIYGYSAEEMVGCPVSRLIPVGQTDDLPQIRERLIRGEKIDHYETVRLRKDGRQIHVSLNISPIKDALGNLTGASIVTRDMTARKQQVEGGPQESEASLRIQYKGISIPTYSWQKIDNDFKLIGYNDAASAITHGWIADLIGTTASVLYRNDPEIPADMWRCFNEKTVIRQKMPYRFRFMDDSKYFMVSYAFVPPDLVMIHTEDFTERRQTEQEMQRRADEFEALYETTRDVAGQQDLMLLLQTIVERATQLLATTSGAAYLYDPKRGDLELVFSNIMAAHPSLRLQLGEGLAGRVAQTRRPLIVNNYHAWAGRAIQYSSIPFRAVLGVPMLYGGELIGVLMAAELDQATHQFSDEDVRLLSLFASQAASIVHNTHLFAETKRRAEQLQIVNQVGQYITRTIELSPLLNEIVHAVCSALNMSYVAIAIVEGDELVFKANTSQFDRADVVSERRKIGQEGITGWVAATGKSWLVPDVSKEPHYIQAADNADVRSELAVPLKTQAGVIGVLDVCSNQLGILSTEHLVLLETIASQVAVAIQNARQFEQTRQRLSELEAISHVSTRLRVAQDLDEMLPILLDTMLTLFNTSAGALWLYDSVVHALRKFVARGWLSELDQTRKPGEGIIGQAFATGQPYVSREFKTDPNTLEAIRPAVPEGWGLVAVPVRTAQEAIGVLLLSVPLPRQINAAEVQLLLTIADIAGNAIHRTRLYEQTQQHVQRLIALRDIDIALTASLDMRVTLNVVLERITTHLGIDAADVLLLNPHTQTLEFAAGRGFRTSGITNVRVRLGAAYAGQAALERRSIIYPNLASTAEGVDRSPLPRGENFAAYFAFPLITKGEIKGVLELFHRVPFNPDAEWLDFLEILSGQVAIAMDNTALFETVQRSNLELSLAYDTTLEGWSRALDLRDKETEGHTVRVTEMTLQLARAMGLGAAELVHIRRGALLHDIGKMGVPDSILLKPGPLSDAEWLIMRMHPVHAHELLWPITYLRPALDIPYYHHEKWDGSGYPQGLKGEQIPLTARIFAVVDVWDALRSDRPYRAGWPDEKVREHINSLANTHFDPQVVEMFLKMAHTAT